VFIHTDIRRIFTSMAVLLTGSGLAMKGDTRIRMLEELITALPTVSDGNFFFFFFLPRLSGLSIRGSTALCWTLAAFSVYESYTHSVGHLGRGISPTQGRYVHTEQHKHRLTHTDIHSLREFRTYDRSVRASEDSSCLRSRGRCVRLN
jgi:hypothetical protein